MLVSVVLILLVAMSESNVSVSGCEPILKARYDNYRFYRVHLVTAEHVKVFQDLEDLSDSYTFYGHARNAGQKLTIMVAADKIAAFAELLKRYNVEAEILVNKKCIY